MSRLASLTLALTLLGLPVQAQMSSEQEVTLGREASGRFEAKYGLAKDPAVQARVRRIGERLTPYCGRHDVTFTFKVANMEEFNALAFPGGFIYTTRGLMKTLDDDQLAFVLSHELTHVAHRHSVKQMSQDKLRQMGLLAALVALNGGNQVSSPQVQVAALVDRVVGSQYSQADEADADSSGIKTMAAAGFDPANAIVALRILARQSGGTPGFLNTLVGSHPVPVERVREAMGVVPNVAFQPTAPSNPAVKDPGAEHHHAHTSGPELDATWTRVLRNDVEVSDLGIRVDPLLSRELEKLLRQGRPPLPVERATSRRLGPEVSLGCYETQFISKELPALAQRSPRLGLAVTKKSDGSREIHLLWP